MTSNSLASTYKKIFFEKMSQFIWLLYQVLIVEDRTAVEHSWSQGFWPALAGSDCVSNVSLCERRIAACALRPSEKGET